MRLNLYYDENDTDLTNNLAFLEHRLYVVRTMIPRGYEAYFQEQARYTSAHTSTAIEGNPLDEETAMRALAEGGNPDDPARIEKLDLNDAYELMALLAEDKSTKIDQGIIRTLHSLVLKGLPDGAARNRGKYRLGPALVVDSATREVRYRPPPPAFVPGLMEEFARHLSDWMERYPGPVTAAMAHFGLVSIHPFEDGNGRTARLIADMVLNLTDWSAGATLSVSRAILERREPYYAALREAQGEDFAENVDVTPFVGFHTDALGRAAAVLEETVVAFNKRRDRFVREVGDIFNPRQVTGLMFMLDIGPLSTSRYARLTDSSQATALSDLSAMVNRQVVVREGAGRSTRYRLHPDLVPRVQADNEGDRSR